MNDIRSDSRNRLGDTFFDLMLIAMYGDEHNIDHHSVLGELVASEVWKTLAELRFKINFLSVRHPACVP